MIDVIVSNLGQCFGSENAMLFIGLCNFECDVTPDVIDGPGGVGPAPGWARCGLRW